MKGRNGGFTLSDVASDSVHLIFNYNQLIEYSDVIKVGPQSSHLVSQDKGQKFSSLKQHGRIRVNYLNFGIERTATRPPRHLPIRALLTSKRPKLRKELGC